MPPRVQIARGSTAGFKTYLKAHNIEKLRDGELYLNKETKELYCGSDGETLVFKGVPIPDTGDIYLPVDK
jgi:hypothetical protein